MNRKRKGTKRSPSTIRVWTYDQACQALPYVTSVMTSLRDHWIAAQGHDRKARQLAGRPGRANRVRLLAQAEEGRAAREAHDRFQKDQDELFALDVYCLDPIRGEAVIPFIHDNQLAWFLYDLFAPDTLQYWRYHNDPLDARRPTAELQETPQVA
jgi:hypothetical protein